MWFDQNVVCFFRFATKEPDGLLLYNGRFNEKHDFIAMEIINEQIQLTFSAGTTFFCFVSFHFYPKCVAVIHLFDSFSGETKTTVSPYVQGGVSDGQWHVVEVHYYNKVSSTLKYCCIYFRCGRITNVNGLANVSVRSLHTFYYRSYYRFDISENTPY